MARRRYPEDRLERAVRVGHGVPGCHEFDALWEPSVDPVVLSDRLRRYKAFVDKARRDRAEMKASMKLQTEEAYIKGLLANAAKWQELDEKATSLAHRIMSKASLSDEDLKALKVLFPEISKQRDRAYGKARQRLNTTSLVASADVTELLNRGKRVPEIGDVVDVEAIEEPGDE